MADMTREEARDILKGIHFGDKAESLKLIDGAIDYLLELPVYCHECQLKGNLDGKWFCAGDGLQGELTNKDFCSYGKRRVEEHDFERTDIGEIEDYESDGDNE